MSDARRHALEAVFCKLLEAAGYAVSGEFAETPARAAELWDQTLLAGVGAPLAKALGTPIPADSEDPVSMLDMGVHLVCPHHLTISFGKAHVAFTPRGSIVGFGGLAELVERATARLVLQEQATQEIARTLRDTLAARAAVAAIEATHPCHNLPHPRSHQARAFTVASAGDPEEARRLETMILAAVRGAD